MKINKINEKVAADILFLTFWTYLPYFTFPVDKYKMCLVKVNQFVAWSNTPNPPNIHHYKLQYK